MASPFQVDVPGTPSRVAIWPAHVGFDEKKRAAWLDTLTLRDLRILQGRIESYQDAARRRFDSEGRSAPLDAAVAGLAADERLLTEAVIRWTERNP